MRNFNTDTDWFAIKSADRKDVLDFLNFTGIEISWEDGVENIIGSNWVMVSSPIKNWVLLCGQYIEDLAFKALEEYESCSNYIERTEKIIDFLKKLSRRFDEAFYFLTHEHHVINKGYFYCKDGELIAGHLNVDGTITEFVDKNPFDAQTEILEIAGKWSINPDIIYGDIDYDKLTWIKDERESFMNQMFFKKWY